MQEKTNHKHTSREWKCTFDGRKYTSNQKRNKKCQCEFKNLRKNVCQKGYIWNPAKCAYENGKYFESVVFQKCNL